MNAHATLEGPSHARVERRAGRLRRATWELDAPNAAVRARGLAHVRSGRFADLARATTTMVLGVAGLHRIAVSVAIVAVEPARASEVITGLEKDVG